jgi:hypothetical protein
MGLASLTINVRWLMVLVLWDRGRGYYKLPMSRWISDSQVPAGSSKGARRPGRARRLRSRLSLSTYRTLLFFKRLTTLAGLLVLGLGLRRPNRGLGERGRPFPMVRRLKPCARSPTPSIAPEGQEGSYMALSVLPFFIAKFFVGMLSGFLLATYCPETACAIAGRCGSSSAPWG